MTEETLLAPSIEEEHPDPSLPPEPCQGESETPSFTASGAGEEQPAIDYEAMATADLAEIKRLDPTYAPASHLSELPFARRFAALRDMGLSVAEALSAVTPRFSPYDTRSHLRPAAPGGARSPVGCLSREELKAAKELFSDLSENELQSLYRRVTAEN